MCIYIYYGACMYIYIMVHACMYIYILYDIVNVSVYMYIYVHLLSSVSEAGILGQENFKNTIQQENIFLIVLSSCRLLSRFPVGLLRCHRAGQAWDPHLMESSRPQR